MSELSRIHSFSHAVLGTTFWLRMAEEDYDFAQRAAESTFAFIDTWSRELGVGLVNSLSSGEKVQVSQGFADLWAASEFFREESKGVFDVRAGGLFKYWEGRAPGAFNPDDPEWQERFNHFKESEYRLEGLEFRAVKSGAQMDFAAVVRGYAVDRMAEILESSWGIHRVLVLAGSSVARALDPPGEGAGWRMAVGAASALTLCRSAIASRDTGSPLSSPLIDARLGEVSQVKGVVRALAATACEARYLSLLGGVMAEAELAPLINGEGTRGLRLANGHHLGIWGESVGPL